MIIKYYDKPAIVLNSFSPINTSGIVVYNVFWNNEVFVLGECDGDRKYQRLAGSYEQYLNHSKKLYRVKKPWEA